MRSIFKWMIVLVLLIAAAGGAGTYWYYLRSDEMLRVEVLNQLERMSPELKFDIERANFDLTGRIHLQGVTAQLPDEAEPALYVSEMVVTLDDQPMTEFEGVSIRRVRMIHPQMHVIRERDGRWNWHGVTWKGNPNQPVPELSIEQGTVHLELERPLRPNRKLKLANVNITSVPAASRKLTATVSTLIEPAGPLSATIEANLDGPPLDVKLKWQRVPVDDELLDLVSEFSPTIQAKLQETRRQMARLAAAQGASSPLPSSNSPARQFDAAGRRIDASPISLRSDIPVDSKSDELAFGMKCQCDLHCRLNWKGSDAPLQYQALAEIRNGQLSNVLLPFPLYEIHGSVYVDPRMLVIRDVRADNGATRLQANVRQEFGKAPQVKLQARNFHIDDALKARLPEALRKQVNSLSLTGLCDLDLGSTQSTQGLSWEADLRLSEGSLSHEKFQYPIRDVSGTLKLRGNRIDIEAQGKGSGVPVTATGWVINPGPENESEIRIKSANVPINTALLDACPEKIRNALNEMNLQGRHDVWLRLWKAPGLGQKYRMTTAMQLQDCSCMLKAFPYRIHHLQGQVLWDEDLITFKGLTGTHDETRLFANGKFERTPGAGRLEMMVTAENAAFDRSLEAALPASLQKTWREFQPSGRFEADTRIVWVPGQPCQVTLPRVKVSDGEVIMRSFPWPLRGISGEFSYEAPRLLMKNVSAQHDDTQIRARGTATFAVGERWQVQFDELHIDDLIPNASFRKALPEQLQRVFTTLSPAGKFSIGTTRLGRVELSGEPEGGPISSAWDVQVLLAGSSLMAGIPIDDIHGRVDLKGNCDGQTTSLTGMLDLDSISVFRQPSGLAHQISHVTGPFSLYDNQFVAGARSMASPSSQPRAPLAERISGDFIDGKMTLDVVADLRDEPDYRLQVTLSRGRLESYAHQYLRGQSNLAGIMNGWLYLWGKGSGEDEVKGRGELQIAPAALYELPVFVQIFRTLRLDASDRTAFDQADVKYNIQNSRFNFEVIDLVGKAISLRGRGYVRFDGMMQLDFYSMLARNQIRIPVIHEIAGILSRGWVGVKVTGHTGSPETRIVPVPEFDEAMKQFMGSFGQAPPQPQPPRLIPKFLQPGQQQ